MKTLLMTALIVGIFAALATRQYNIAITAHKLSTKSEKPNFTTYYLFVFICVTILASVAGLRFLVGTDFGAYYWGYPRWEAQFAERWKIWDEPALSTLAKLCYPISEDGGFFIFVTAFLTVSLFGYTTAKHSDDFFFSLVLYTFTCWTGCFNGVRQYLAAAVIFAGHRLILERKFIKFCIVVFIAASFHVTALIVFPMYFLITQVLDLKKITFILVAGIAMIYSYDFLFTLMGIMSDSDTGGADTNYAQREINPLRIAIAFAPIILYFFLLFQKKSFTGKENFYMGFVFVRAAIVYGTSNSAYLNRAGIYFAAFIPIALSLLIKKFPKNQQNLLKTIVLVLYFIVWYYTEVSGVSWMWIWERYVPYFNKYV